jgi:hypothetical protein
MSLIRKWGKVVSYLNKIDTQARSMAQGNEQSSLAKGAYLSVSTMSKPLWIGVRDIYNSRLADVQVNESKKKLLTKWVQIHELDDHPTMHLSEEESISFLDGILETMVEDPDISASTRT